MAQLFTYFMSGKIKTETETLSVWSDEVF